ncbi:MAG TPA: sensor histidine kinase KdpD [Thermoanaerobaculia bacterium]|jgi:two-component system sensor histidine kinase KdpD|nr:sensor histidine kinase KdpD [Thermoanaerobaculia bacterium]
MTPDRPDPDELLALANAEEERERRGKLKVFFGAAAGVGKTYAMLEGARELARRGVDVVVGVVETHGRKETEALLEGLEVLPRRVDEHRGVELAEFDLDAVRVRRPAVVLVDELAHTNAPGSRHAKRWQDVEELLAEGIDVWTTVNVQHLESLNDLVGKVTGVAVRETVPDSILERADQVELVDLPPEELLKRLQEGKVYNPEQSSRAIEGFFRPGNLIALRELALRKTAERVDAQMQLYRQAHNIGDTWPVAERLLVAVSSGPTAGQLVRGGRRLAERLRAEWVVVYVETPAELRLSQAERDRVWQTLRLAERLGAETVTLSGERPAEEILKYARRRNVSKIVVGKPLHSRWKDVLFGSVRDDLVRGSGGIDVYVISGEEGGGWPAAEKPGRPERDVRGYVAALLVTGLTLGLCISVRSYFQPTNLAMLMLLSVVGISSRSTRGPAILASVLSVAGFDFFLVPPYYTFAITDAEYLLTFAVMLTTAIVVSTLTVRLREQAEAARTREERTAALYAMSRDLAAAPDLDAVLKAAAQHIHSVFLSQVLLLLPDETGRLAERAAEVVTYLFDIREQAVSQWVFDHGRMAGKTTDTLPAAKGLYIPLRTSQGIVGVLGVHPADPQRLVAPEHLHLLEAFANQIALAIE